MGAVDAPSSSIDSCCAQSSGFRFAITRLEFKWKMSQTAKAKDREVPSVVKKKKGLNKRAAGDDLIWRISSRAGLRQQITTPVGTADLIARVLACFCGFVAAGRRPARGLRTQFLQAGIVCFGVRQRSMRRVCCQSAPFSACANRYGAVFTGRPKDETSCCPPVWRTPRGRLDRGPTDLYTQRPTPTPAVF